MHIGYPESCEPGGCPECWIAERDKEQMETWEAENSIGTNIVLWACYDYGDPWIVTAYVLVHCYSVWDFAAKHNSDITLWCGKFEAKP